MAGPPPAISCLAGSYFELHFAITSEASKSPARAERALDGHLDAAGGDVAEAVGDDALGVADGELGVVLVDGEAVLAGLVALDERAGDELALDAHLAADVRLALV